MIQRIIRILLAVMIVATMTGHSSVYAQVDDQRFFSGNGIDFFSNEADACGGNLSDVASNDRPSIAYNFFLGKSLTNSQAVALLGNLQQESGMNPRALNSESGAYGIAQWVDDRKDALYQKSHYVSGVDDITEEFRVQLNYLWEELEGTESASLDALKSASTNNVSALAVIFGESFFGASGGEGDRRGQLATSFAERFDGKSVSSSPAGCGVIGPDGFVYFSQKDPAWKDKAYGSSTIERSGCGPTSVAMIISTLLKQRILPDEVAAAGEANGSFIEGVGTAHSPLMQAVQQKWGVQFEFLGGRMAEIDTALESGKIVYIGGSGTAPYTDGGHIVVVRGKTSDGKYIVADPWRGASDEYTTGQIMAGKGTTIALSK